MVMTERSKQQSNIGLGPSCSYQRLQPTLIYFKDKRQKWRRKNEDNLRLEIVVWMWSLIDVRCHFFCSGPAIDV